MRLNDASITFAGRSFEIPVNHLHQILVDSASATCEAQFQRDQLVRWIAIEQRRANPDRHREFRITGGSYWLGIAGEQWTCPTLATVLVTAMRWLHHNRGDAMQHLARRRKYSRAYISTDPIALYGGRKDLAGHAREFAPRWYVDTNQSASNTQRHLAVALAQAGLVHRRDWYFGSLY